MAQDLYDSQKLELKYHEEGNDDKQGINEEVYTINSTIKKRTFIDYLIIPVAFLVEFIIFGFLNNVGTLKYHWDSHPITNNVFLEQAASANFGFIYISALLGFQINEMVGPGATFAFGSILMSASLLIVSLFPSPIVIFTFYGVILGTGASLVLFSILCVIKKCFSDNLSLVNALIACGPCLGTMVQSLVLDNLCNLFGWIKVFRAFAMLIVATTFVAFLIEAISRRQQTQEMNQSFSKKKEKSVIWSILSNTRFIILCVSFFVFCLGYLVIYIYIIAYSQSRGVSKSMSRMLIGYYSIGSLVGRICFGLIANFVGRRRIFLLLICFYFMGLLNVISVFCHNFASFVLFCIALGIFDGGFITLTFPVICDMFSPSEHGQVFENSVQILDTSDQENMATAICYVVQGISLMMGPIITNFIIDKTDKISIVFMFSGLLLISSSIILSLVRFVE